MSHYDGINLYRVFYQMDANAWNTIERCMFSFVHDKGWIENTPMRLAERPHVGDMLSIPIDGIYHTLEVFAITYNDVYLLPKEVL